MVVIKGVSAKSILDSRKEKTIFISIKTNVGDFSASAPNGKSTGKFEVKSYKKDLEGDIKALKDFSEYFSDENIDNLKDLRRIEDIVEGHIGANSLFALESSILKAIAKEKKKQIWQIINPKLKSAKMPRLVGNVIGGGKHSIENLKTDKNPDFQEFLLIPKLNIKKSLEKNNKIKSELKIDLKRVDEDFKEEKNDENAWKTSLNEKEVLDLLKNVGVDIGIDVAASSFYKRGKYHYQNPMLDRNSGEQSFYLGSLIKNYNLYYIEDPFDENDFDSFVKLLKKYPEKLIVGDDLIVTNSKRLEKAIEKKAVNAIIVKPNQCGSLLEVARVCELAKNNKIKIVFSHRSGETEEDILADLAFGFQADFFKCGIDGKEREAKLNRLAEIEKSLNK